MAVREEFIERVKEQLPEEPKYAEQPVQADTTEGHEERRQLDEPGTDQGSSSQGSSAESQDQERDTEAPQRDGVTDPHAWVALIPLNKEQIEAVLWHLHVVDHAYGREHPVEGAAKVIESKCQNGLRQLKEREESGNPLPKPTWGNGWSPRPGLFC